MPEWILYANVSIVMVVRTELSNATSPTGFAAAAFTSGMHH
jgi:hypothetical protein